MKDFKVGDRVRIRQWDDMAEEFGVDNSGDIKCCFGFIDYMKPLCGRTATISEIKGINIRLADWDIDDDYTLWEYSMDMLEKIEEEK